MTTFTPIEDQYIQENYLTIPLKRIANNLNRSSCGVKGRMNKLNLSIPFEVSQARLKASQYKKGTEPPNKGKKQSEYMSAAAIERTKATRFQKGRIAHNHQEIGTRRTVADGYIEIKIKQPNIWQLEQRYCFEKYHKVKIPDKHNILFLDGNKQNLSKENLVCLSDAELMKRNTIQRYPQELQRTIKLTSKLKKLCNS